ncbi:putative transcriptional regulator [Streptacidiphilus sp. MAP12-16]|uniref:hypothetical protein n=1 Tax=Streptacidiphilus sp. MAP12-16 TaxID=3156300 RepID=UPI0035167B5F
MSKTVAIRIPDEVYEQLQARARAEGTTVTALVTEAAVRDPRLNQGAGAAAAFLARHAAEFAESFPDEEPAPAGDTRNPRAA